MTFRRLVLVLALAATAAFDPLTVRGTFGCPEKKYVVSALVEGEVACAQGRVELVCDAEGVCSGKSPTNMANVDVAYGALKMTCTSKKVCEFTDALVGESTWGGHIDLECRGTQACWNSKFTSSSGKIVAVCQGGPKTCLATTFSSGRVPRQGVWGQFLLLLQYRPNLSSDTNTSYFNHFSRNANTRSSW